MPPLDIAHDPVLRLLPEPPDSFLLLSPKEQARRGRLWLTLYGAGYMPDHAWWFAMSAEEDIAEMLATIAEVPDEDFVLMVKGRQTYEAGKAMAQSQVEQ